MGGDPGVARSLFARDAAFFATSEKKHLEACFGAFRISENAVGTGFHGGPFSNTLAHSSD
jgi:hypothetical protein